MIQSNKCSKANNNNFKQYLNLTYKIDFKKTRYQN